MLTGMRHWDRGSRAPSRAALELGHDALVGLVLAPHWSSLSIAKYEQLFDAAVAGRVETRFVREWGPDEGLVALLADRVRASSRAAIRTSSSLRTRSPRGSSSPAIRTRLSSRPHGSSPIAPRSRPVVVRLPAVADRRAVARPRHPRPPRRARGQPGRRRARVPVGFVSDHLEIKWDLDVEAAQRAGVSAYGSPASRCRTPIPVRRGAFRHRPARARSRDRVASRERARSRSTGASRRFVVRARETHTLKELLVARGRTGAQEVWALRDLTLAVTPGESVGLIGRNGSGKSTLLRLIAGIIRPTTGGSRPAARSARCSSSARASTDFTGRENVELNGMLQGLTRARIRERFDEIVAFAEARARDRPARRDMLVRDDDAARLRDRGVPRGGRAPPRRGLRRRGRELPAEVLGVIAAFKERGGTILFVSHDASAVERLCDRAVLLRTASSRSTAPCTRRSPATGGSLAEDGSRPTKRVPRTPPGPARASLQMSVSSGRTVSRARASSQASRSGSRSSSAAVPRRPRSISSFATAQGCSSPRRSSTPARSAGTADGRSLRFDVAAPPLQFGRFDVGLALVGDDGRLLDRLPRGVPLLVYPDGEGRGLVRLEGTWRHEAKDAGR